MRLVVLLTAPAASGIAARADAPPPSEATLQIDVGFDGAYKVGRWTPIRVGDSGEDVTSVVIAASDPDGRPVEFGLTRDSNGKEFSGLFQSGRLDAPLQVHVTREGSTESVTLSPSNSGDETLRSYRQSTKFWLLVGTQPGFQAAAERLNDATQRAGDEPAVIAFPIAHETLSAAADSLESLDLIVLGPGDVSVDQSEALRRWVLRGGRLVVAVGSEGDQLSRTPLAAWLPVELSAAEPERQTSVLTSRLTAFVPDSAPLRTLEELTVTGLRVKDGVTLVEGPRGPIVTRSAVGLGIVTVVAVDLHRPPFFDPPAGDSDKGAVLWEGLPSFCRKLAGLESATGDAANAPAQAQLAPTGISDVQSQLAAILDHFPGVDRPSSWNVIGLLALYLVVVGPLDYLLVHRLLRRPQLTWVTLPAWILLAGWWSTTSANVSNGTTSDSNQIQVLDVAADTGLQRREAWFSLYSPATRRYTIGAETSAADAPTADDKTRANLPPRLCWLPRPEEGFRGMYRRGGIDLGTAGYRLEPRGGAAEHVPAAIWSSLAMVAQSDAIQSEGPPLAESRQVYDSHGRLVRWDLVQRLPGELVDWFAVQGVQVRFPLADADGPMTLPSGTIRDMNRGCGQQLLKSYIQGESSTLEKTKHGEQRYVRSDEYDPLGLDSHRLMRMLSFYQAVGGRGYTGLTNQTLDRLDFSEFIHLDRLIVFGRLRAPVTTFSVDGRPVADDEPVTYVRLVVPIVRETLETSPP